MDQGGHGTQIFALLIRTVVVYYTHVLQVRIEGTELQKGTAKKKFKKCAISSEEIFRSRCPIESRKFFFLTSHAAEIASFSSATLELSNAMRVL